MPQKDCVRPRLFGSYVTRNKLRTSFIKFDTIETEPKLFEREIAEANLPFGEML